jgi:hypothetical protein
MLDTAMGGVPADIIASWPKPNYVDPVTRGPTIFVVNGTFLCLATIAVAIRLYTRIGIRKWFGADDALIVFAYVSGEVNACFLVTEKVLTTLESS